MRPRPADERFWEKVDKTETCWIWTGATTGTASGSPYGMFVPDARRSGPRRKVLAHRYAYEQIVGPIAEGLTLDHVKTLCRSTLCVNPAHLEPVTIAENIRRAREGRTHCDRGIHSWTDDNIYVQPSTGGRTCRACQRERQRAARERKGA